MKKISTFLALSFAVLFIFFSCCNPSSKIEKAAQAQVQATLTELAKDPSSVKFDNIQTKFLNDSLCILQMNWTAKNGLGHEITDHIEYYYIGSKGKFYEAYQEFSGDGAIFCTEEQYNKQKKGKIYESLSYDEGLRYLTALFTNTSGREAGNSGSGTFVIDVPTGTGQWDLKAYTDEFGEEGNEKYLILRGTGTFSNSATTGSNLSALLFVGKGGDFSFRLIEYNSHVVKSNDNYSYHIKDSEGEVYDMILLNNYSSGQMSSWRSSDVTTMSTILNKGGVFTVAVRELYAYGTPSTYLFKMDATGFGKAIQYLQ
jgi:hypothetical protein